MCVARGTKSYNIIIIIVIITTSLSSSSSSSSLQHHRVAPQSNNKTNCAMLQRMAQESRTCSCKQKPHASDDAARMPIANADKRSAPVRRSALNALNPF